VVTDGAGHETLITNLYEGHFFGETSIVTEQPRNANVEAMDPVLALEIAQDTLAELVREFPSVEGELRTFYKERIAESLLARSAMFGHLAVRERKRLAAYFTYTQAKRGELILREGDTSDAFYALRQGRVSVFTGGLDETTGLPLAELGPGEVFGEVAALKGARRTASVRALTDAELLRIEASDLQEFLAANAEVRAMIEEKIEARAAETIQRLHESS
jgi:CRP-like cAMP-binding protein